MLQPTCRDFSRLLRVSPRADELSGTQGYTRMPLTLISAASAGLTNNVWLGCWRSISGLKLSWQHLRIPKFESSHTSPILLETSGLRLQTERHCRHVDTGLLALSGSPPRWRYRHCGASVVTALVPLQPKGISKMSHRNTPNKSKVVPAKHA